MLKTAVVLLAFTPAPLMADGLSCRDAAAFYHFAMFTSKAVGKVSGACVGDMTQPACIAFLDAVKESGDAIGKAKEGSADQYVLYLKDQCPDDLPDSPEKF